MRDILPSQKALIALIFPTLTAITQVKAYLRRQWTKILSNRVSVQDFVFAKEVR